MTGAEEQIERAALPARRLRLRRRACPDESGLERMAHAGAFPERAPLPERPRLARAPPMSPGLEWTNDL